MKITDKLAARQTFSFEIFPPKGDLPLEKAYEVASALAQDRPDWVSVTYSAGGSGNSENTVPIAASLERDLGVTALAHLTCLGSTKADVDAYVAQLHESGVQNVLALRGDRRPGREAKDFSARVRPHHLPARPGPWPVHRRSVLPGGPRGVPGR